MVQENGCLFYVEETCLSPHTMNYYIKGPDNLFEVFGYITSIISIAGINTATGTKIGKNVVKFKDGTLITFVSPDM